MVERVARHLVPETRRVPYHRAIFLALHITGDREKREGQLHRGGPIDHARDRSIVDRVEPGARRVESVDGEVIGNLIEVDVHGGELHGASW